MVEQDEVEGFDSDESYTSSDLSTGTCDMEDYLENEKQEDMSETFNGVSLNLLSCIGS